MMVNGVFSPSVWCMVYDVGVGVGVWVLVLGPGWIVWVAGT